MPRKKKGADSSSQATLHQYFNSMQNTMNPMMQNMFANMMQQGMQSMMQNTMQSMMQNPGQSTAPDMMMQNMAQNMFQNMMMQNTQQNTAAHGFGNAQGPATPLSNSQTSEVSTDFGAAMKIGSLQIPKQPSFPDDCKRMGTGWKASGLVWLHGAGRVTPKRFRCSLVSCCNSNHYPMIKLAHLNEEQVDMMCYVVFGLLPDSKAQDWGCDTKRNIMTAARQQYITRLQKNASRLDALSEEWDNLAMIAMRIGYPEQLLSPDMKSKWLHIKNHMMNGCETDGAQRAQLELMGQKRKVALTDGSVAGDEEEHAAEVMASFS